MGKVVTIHPVPVEQPVDYTSLLPNVRPDNTHEWILETALVAQGYGVSDEVVRQHKSRNADELIEGKHFVSCVTNSNARDAVPTKRTFWTKRGVVQLVDSRLIAQELGIQHKNLIETIREHQAAIEKDFGILAFETEVSGKVGQPVKYALLTEEQVYFITTLSRNTPEVMAFKTWLVKAFQQVRLRLQQVVAPVAVSTDPMDIVETMYCKVLCFVLASVNLLCNSPSPVSPSTPIRQPIVHAVATIYQYAAINHLLTHGKGFWVIGSNG